MSYYFGVFTLLFLFISHHANTFSRIFFFLKYESKCRSRMATRNDKNHTRYAVHENPCNTLQETSRKRYAYEKITNVLKVPETQNILQVKRRKLFERFSLIIYNCTLYIIVCLHSRSPFGGAFDSSRSSYSCTQHGFYDTPRTFPMLVRSGRLAIVRYV